jgi:hypothetical protein
MRFWKMHCHLKVVIRIIFSHALGIHIKWDLPPEPRTSNFGSITGKINEWFNNLGVLRCTVKN